MTEERIVLINPIDLDSHIHFRYCSPGKFRISNIPKLGAKNTVVEFSKGFWIQETTVSLGLYEVVHNEKYFEHGLNEVEKFNFPWNSMDFQEVQAFLGKLNSLLTASGQNFKVDIPSRFEWEHALLVGDDGDWSWGYDEKELDNYAWYANNSQDKIHPSKQKRCNKWGLFDLYGNVHEYCYDVAFDFNQSLIADPQPQYPSEEDILPSMGGAYDSEIENCRTNRYIGYYNQYIEPTGVRLIIRD